MTGRSRVPARFRAVGPEASGACFPLLRQLRPQLRSPGELAVRWRRQAAAGYRGLALWSGRTPWAFAGYRVLESLMHGRFLYVDDLVTDRRRRGRGLGARLLRQLEREARRLGCGKLVLDTGLENVRGHRFYYRQGLVAQALRFNLPLD